MMCQGVEAVKGCVICKKSGKTAVITGGLTFPASELFFDRRCDPATGIEFAADPCPARFHGFNKIVENAVDRVFVENSKVTIRQNVQF
jgi:hypothetical protein